MEAQSSESVSFGDFSFHFQSGFLYRDGGTVLLQHRATKVLRYLLERPRQVISREDLIENVWQSAHISDASVTEAIKQLRKTLGDDPTEPTYIQTIHGRGYRFIAPIREDVFSPSTAVVATAAAAAPPASAGGSLFWDPRLWMATTLLLAIVLLVVVFWG